MKKHMIVLVALSIIMISGCGNEDRRTASGTGRNQARQKSGNPPEKLTLSGRDRHRTVRPENEMKGNVASAERAIVETEDTWRVKSTQKVKDTIREGEFMRPFKAEDQNQNVIDLESYKGKYVFLDFWASWCKPCHEELPYLQKLTDKYGDEEKLVLIGISLDRSKKPFLQYVKKHDIEWPNIYDRKTEGSIAALYGVKSIPFTVLIGPDGRVIATKLRGETMLKDIEKHLKK